VSEEVSKTEEVSEETFSPTVDGTLVAAFGAGVVGRGSAGAEN